MSKELLLPFKGEEPQPPPAWELAAIYAMQNDDVKGVRAAFKQRDKELAEIDLANPYHLPGGTPQGGQFTSAPGGSANEKEMSRQREEDQNVVRHMNPLTMDENNAALRNYFTDRNGQFNEAALKQYLQDLKDAKDPSKYPPSLAHTKEEALAATLHGITAGEIPAEVMPEQIWRDYNSILDLIDKGGLANGDPSFEGTTGRRCVMVAGLSGAGKSSAIDHTPDLRQSDGRYTLVDADESLKTLQNYDNGKGSWSLHDESAAMGNAMFSTLADRGYDMVYPRVGKSTNSVIRDIDYLLSKGYQVDYDFMDVGIEKALERASGRYMTKGRVLDLNMIVKQDSAPRTAWFDLMEKYKDNPNVRFRYFNNNVPFGHRPIEIHNPVR